MVVPCSRIINGDDDDDFTPSPREPLHKKIMDDNICAMCGAPKYCSNPTWLNYRDKMAQELPPGEVLSIILNLCNTCINKRMRNDFPGWFDDSMEGTEHAEQLAELKLPFKVEPEPRQVVVPWYKKQLFTHAVMMAFGAFLALCIEGIFFLEHNYGVSRYVPEQSENILKAIGRDLKEVEKIFKNQDVDLWPQILSVFKDSVDEPFPPAVYLLLHKNDGNTASCVAKLIAELANKHIYKSDKYLLMNGKEFSKSNYTDYGVLLEKVAKSVQEYHVLVVNDVQDVPGSLAQMFGSLCEQYNPTVRRAVYILIADAGNQTINQPMEIAENVLKEAWKDLETDILAPLITRVTTMPLRIVEETDISCLPKTQLIVELKP